MLSWKRLDEKNKESICSKCEYSSMALLDKLIEEYGFYNYSDDNYRELPIIENIDDEITERIFDHAITMANFSGDMYLVSTPYYDSEHITEVLSEYIGTKVFKVLGKDRSYYYPNNTNLFVINLNYFMR